MEKLKREMAEHEATEALARFFDWEMHEEKRAAKNAEKK